MLSERGLSTTAMVLAAGLGTRMRPITDAIPKPLVRIAGKTMVDHVLDRLAEVKVETAVVNVHHHADQMERHLADRAHPRVVFSDERAGLLDSGGGTKKVIDRFGGKPFLLANADTLWIDGASRSNVRRLVKHWRPEIMDVLLLLAATATSIGFDGKGDFAFNPDGRLRRRAEREIVPFAYAGFAIFAAHLFDDAPDGPFSLNRLFDRAMKDGRLHGVRLDGVWMHVGTPDAVQDAERALKQSVL